MLDKYCKKVTNKIIRNTKQHRFSFTFRDCSLASLIFLLFKDVIRCFMGAFSDKRRPDVMFSPKFVRRDGGTTRDQRPFALSEEMLTSRKLWIRKSTFVLGDPRIQSEHLMKRNRDFTLRHRPRKCCQIMLEQRKLFCHFIRLNFIASECTARFT